MNKQEKNIDRFNQLTQKILGILNECFPMSAILNANTLGLEMGKFAGSDRLLSNDESFLAATLGWLEGEGIVRHTSGEAIYALTLKGLEILDAVPESLQRK